MLLRKFWVLLVLVLLAGSVLSPQVLPPSPSEGVIHTVVIDAGHGGKDPGASGSHYKEKNLALGVALELKRVLNQKMPHVKVIMTRESDFFVPLHKRASMARDQEADFFISIHCNGLKNRQSSGTETYVLGVNDGQENYGRIIAENESILFEEDREEMYGGFDPSTPEGYIFFRLLKLAFRKESSHFAEKVQKYYREDESLRDRGVKQGPFVVLYQCGMPAILTEVGFITNPAEERFIASQSGRAFLANSIYRSLREYNEEFLLKEVEEDR